MQTWIIYIKIIGALCVSTGCLGTGLAFSRSWKRRCEQLEEMQQSFRLLYGEIRCTGAELPEVFEQVSQHLGSPFSDFYLSLSEKMRQMEGKTMAILWQNGVKRYMHDTYLTKEDRKLFLVLGRQLGYLDREMQLSLIQASERQLEERLAMLKSQLEEKQKLSVTLGLLSGFFMMVVLI